MFSSEIFEKHCYQVGPMRGDVPVKLAYFRIVRRIYHLLRPALQQELVEWIYPWNWYFIIQFHLIQNQLTVYYQELSVIVMKAVHIDFQIPLGVPCKLSMVLADFLPSVLHLHVFVKFLARRRFSVFLWLLYVFEASSNDFLPIYDIKFCYNYKY